MPRGRPPNIDIISLTDAIEKNKSKIVRETGNLIAPKSDDVWKLISEELNGSVAPLSIYAYVVNNRFNLKTILFGNESSEDLLDLSKKADTTPSVEEDKEEEPVSTFILTFGKAEFNELITERQRTTKDSQGKIKSYAINVFKLGQWTEVVSKKIFDDFRLLHGYHFKNSYITKDKESDHFTGKSPSNIFPPS